MNMLAPALISAPTTNVNTKNSPETGNKYDVIFLNISVITSSLKDINGVQAELFPLPQGVYD